MSLQQQYEQSRDDRRHRGQGFLRCRKEWTVGGKSPSFGLLARILTAAFWERMRHLTESATQSRTDLTVASGSPIVLAAGSAGQNLE